jgi:hypothetical protein
MGENRMSDKNVNLTVAQQKFLTQRLESIKQRRRPSSWGSSSDDFSLSHPKPESVEIAQKEIERLGKFVEKWENSLSELKKKEQNRVDRDYNVALDSILFGTAKEARASVDKFDRSK